MSAPVSTAALVPPTVKTMEPQNTAHSMGYHSTHITGGNSGTPHLRCEYAHLCDENTCTRIYRSQVGGGLSMYTTKCPRTLKICETERINLH